MSNLSQLTDTQRIIYDGLANNVPVEKIAKNLATTVALVNANITRIKNKGVELPVAGKLSMSVPATHVQPKDLLGPAPEKPVASGGSENDRIAAMLNQGGKAINAEELRALADKVAGNAAREIHPMILMGVAIQFVKLCGGRMTAHQVIEDVYIALRMFASENGASLPDDEGGQTEPFPKNDKERLQFLENQTKSQSEKIQELEGKLRKFTGSPSSMMN